MTTAATDKPTNREERVFAIMDALEGFVAAKISYEKGYAGGAEYASTRELDKARDELQETLKANL